MIGSVELNNFFIQQLQFYHQPVSKVITIGSTSPFSPEKTSREFRLRFEGGPTDGPSDPVKRTTTENCGGERKREKERKDQKNQSEKALAKKGRNAYPLWLLYNYNIHMSRFFHPLLARLGFSIFLSCLLTSLGLPTSPSKWKKKKKKKKNKRLIVIYKNKQHKKPQEKSSKNLKK